MLNNFYFSPLLHLGEGQPRLARWGEVYETLLFLILKYKTP